MIAASPNWRSRSISSTRLFVLAARYAAEVRREHGLAGAALRREHRDHLAARRSSRASCRHPAAGLAGLADRERDRLEPAAAARARRRHRQSRAASTSHGSLSARAGRSGPSSAGGSPPRRSRERRRDAGRSRSSIDAVQDGVERRSRSWRPHPARRPRADDLEPAARAPSACVQRPAHRRTSPSRRRGASPRRFGAMVVTSRLRRPPSRTLPSSGCCPSAS